MESGAANVAYFYITLDDNAAYGFNIREAEKIRSFINNARNLTNERCPVYPGADEVQLVMLSKYATLLSHAKPNIYPIYRNASSINMIPSFERRHCVMVTNPPLSTAYNMLHISVEAS